MEEISLAFILVKKHYYSLSDEVLLRLWMPTSVPCTDLVGVSTRQKMPYGSSESFCSTGNTNAAVFPLPVLAQPIQSRPVERNTSTMMEQM